MSLKKWMTVAGCAGFVSAMAFGCSSTTTSSSPDDGGTTSEGGRRDSGGTVDTGADDAGDVCTPPGSVTYTKKWVAPHPHINGCSQANIDLYLKTCLGTGADQTACNAFEASALGKTCVQCILGTQATGLGPLIVSGNFVSINFAGCIAVGQGTTADGAGCASAVLYQKECRDKACAACLSDKNTTVDSLGNCESAADTGACSAEATSANCIDALVDAGGAVGGCFAAGANPTFESLYNAIVPIFCLDTGAGDGGTDTGISDAPSDG